jgi:hypothetical protein
MNPDDHGIGHAVVDLMYIRLDHQISDCFVGVGRNAYTGKVGLFLDGCVTCSANHQDQDEEDWQHSV